MAAGQINLKINGGRKLTGATAVNTAKNSAVALLAASLLNRGETRLRRVPRIEEVNRLIEVLTSIGVSVRRQGEDLLIHPPRRLKLEKLNRQAAEHTRSILLFLGPLCHWQKRFSLPHAGGCALGERTIRPHLFALEKLGLAIEVRSRDYQIGWRRLRPAAIVLYETGDTVTENVLMAAAGIPGKTIIKFASANYMVRELCYFLGELGVKIEGVGTSTLTVRGREMIDRKVSYSLGEDPVEAMLFISLAATTGSSLVIKRCPIEFLELELLKLKKMGLRFKIGKRYLSQNGRTLLTDIKTFPSRLRALQEKIHPLPFPGINIDNLPFFVPIATQARGTTLIHDWVYENRAIYYLELSKLGATVRLADPHRVFIEGPTPLRGAEIICPPALRPAAIILIAMLAAPGVSILRNIYSINRGYEDLVSRLRRLGAKISLLRN